MLHEAKRKGEKKESLNSGRELIIAGMTFDRLGPLLFQ